MVIQRYIQLANLSDGLLKMVDDRKLGFTQGVNISYLKLREQEIVERVLHQISQKISISQSEMIREKKGCITDEEIIEICNTRKERPQGQEIRIRKSILNRYFSKDTTEEEIEKIILQLLDQWKKEKGGEQDAKTD